LVLLGPDADVGSDELPTRQYGYHTTKIDRGVLGEPSKIREEVEELEDALAQGVRIMALCELADIYGALKACAERNGATMEDLRLMSEATARAFAVGDR
jgi:hypothetical protein